LKINDYLIIIVYTFFFLCVYDQIEVPNSYFDQSVARTSASAQVLGVDPLRVG